MLEIMRQMNVPVSQVRAGGGGARSDFWRSMQADVYQSPLVITNAGEGPAYGVALLAGVGTGVWTSVEQACSASISQREQSRPEQETRGGIRAAVSRIRQTVWGFEGAVRGDGGALKGNDEREMINAEGLRRARTATAAQCQKAQRRQHRDGGGFRHAAIGFAEVDLIAAGQLLVIHIGAVYQTGGLRVVDGERAEIRR